jgi:purine-binding chemotaxis protein CheW
MKKSNEELGSFLSFKVGNELFAANVSHVINILEMVPITKVPKSPEYMLGVINLRGSVLPLIDFRIKLGIEATAFTNNTCILVLSVAQGEGLIQIGAVVDGVQEVLEIGEDKISPPPSIHSDGIDEYIKGMYQLNEEKFLMLLDIDKILEKDEIIQIIQDTKQNETVEQ